MHSSLAGGADHVRQAFGLGFERRDLPIDTTAGILEDRSSLPRVLGGTKALPIPLAGDLVLEQLADLGQGEARVVAELLDVAKAVEVRLVVQPVRPPERAGRLEEADLLVVPDRPSGQPGVGRHLLDTRRRRSSARLVAHRRDATTTLT